MGGGGDEFKGAKVAIFKNNLKLVKKKWRKCLTIPYVFLWTYVMKLRWIKCFSFWYLFSLFLNSPFFFLTFKSLSYYPRVVLHFCHRHHIFHVHNEDKVKAFWAIFIDFLFFSPNLLLSHLKIPVLLPWGSSSFLPQTPTHPQGS